MNARILSYSLDVNNDIPFTDNSPNIIIKSIEIDILLLDAGTSEVDQKDFTVTIADDKIRVCCKKNNASYIVLPYTILVKIGESIIYEKIVVGNWLEKDLLKKHGTDIAENSEFGFAGEGRYDLALSIAPNL